jgi:protoporphyrinogen oxidase
MYDIIIFGGGLSGLTLAHELLKQKFKILIIEKDNELGGMASSDTTRNLFPSEHSWSGYAPFYKNTFQLLKEIPYYDTNVFNNLSIPIDFHLLYDKEYNYKSSLTVKDKIILYYIGANYLLSDNRREYYYSYNIQPFLKKYLSNDGYNHMINYLTGPGYGMNKNEISMGHLFHFPIISYIHKDRHKHSHSPDGKKYDHKGDEAWHVMNGPTNDVWINPWIKHLKENGVDILTNTELVKINYKQTNITSVEIKQNGMIKRLKAKEYILSINPFNTVDILRNSKCNIYIIILNH